MSSKPEFEILVDAHSREIFVYLWRIVGETMEAEDCLQDAFLRAFRAYPRLGLGENYRAWLYKIASNVARTHLKRRNRSALQTTDLDPAHLPNNPSLLDDLDRRSNLAAVAEAVEDLPYKQRTALILRKYQGLSYPDVAAALGGTEEGARANVYQALKKLRARFSLADVEMRSDS